MYSQVILARWWVWVFVAGVVSLGGCDVTSAAGPDDPDRPGNDSDRPGNDSDVLEEDSGEQEPEEDSGEEEPEDYACSPYLPADRPGVLRYEDDFYSSTLRRLGESDGLIQVVYGDVVDLATGEEAGDTTVYTYVCDAEGTKLAQKDTEWDGGIYTRIFDPPYLVMPHELVEGASWEVEYDVWTLDEGDLVYAGHIDWYYEVGATATVEVPAGTFTATLVGNPDSANPMLWHASGVGLVKANAEGWLELIDYEF